ASQQQAAAEQWLHVVLVFCAAAALFALTNAFIGLLACANERRYENAVRGLLGAAPRALGRAQLKAAAQNALLGVAAGAPFGVVSAVLLRRSWQGDLRSGVTPYAFMALGSVACLYVAVIAARSAARRFRRRGWLGDALAPEARSTPGFGAGDLRALLTGAQLACAIALTIIGMLVWSYTRSARPATEHTARDRYVAHVRGSPLYAARLLARLGASANVEAESIASSGALLGVGKVGNVLSNCGQCVRAKMLTPLFPVETQQHVVGANFFAAAGIALRHGREFHDTAEDAHSVIVNESFARLAFDSPVPIGKVVLPAGLYGAAYKVVGIVEDVPALGLHTLEPDPLALTARTPVSGSPAIYFSARAHPPRSFDVVIQAHRPVSLAGVGFEPLAGFLDRAQAPQQWFAQVIILLGAMLCAAALTSVFITTMLSVQSGREEIAVRRALGASRRHIGLLVYRRVAALLLRASIAGVVLSVALSRTVEIFVPGLPAFDARISLAVCGLFAVTACLAALPPVRRALQTAPARGA
ncbi:MAG TPA: FtsX-like permease family protein, partial [Longimicrobiales bacterium]